MLDRGFGILNLPVLVLPHRARWGRSPRYAARRGTRHEYQTPVGSIRTAELFTEEMLDAGTSISWVSECPIREQRDFAVLRYAFLARARGAASGLRRAAQGGGRPRRRGGVRHRNRLPDSPHHERVDAGGAVLLCHARLPE